jgi:WD40 repeat protein
MVTAIAVTPDGDRAITRALDGTVRVWQLPSGTEVLQLDDFEDPIGDLAVCSDGERAVAIGGECELARTVFWDLDSGETLNEVVGADPTRRGTLTADGRLAVFVEEQRFFVMDIEENRFIRGLNYDMSSVNAVVVSLNGRWITSAISLSGMWSGGSGCTRYIDMDRR